MNRSSRAAGVAVSLVCFLLALLTSGGRGHGDPAQPAPAVEIVAAPPLISAESAMLRKEVLRGLGTGIQLSGRWRSHRVVVLTQPVAELHQTKRIATLRLLLEMVENGKPEDALSAAGHAAVLEVDELEGLFYADFPPEMFDASEGPQDPSQRQKTLEWLRERITDAERQQRRRN